MTKYKVDTKKQTLIIVRGIQGSGKSTFAKKFLEAGFIHHENDKFFTDENGVYKFDLSKHQEAKDETLRMVMKDLREGKNVVVSNTFNSLKELHQYKDLAEALEVKVKVVKMELNFESLHSVPKEIIEKARQTYEKHPIEKVISDPNYKVSFENSRLRNRMTR